MAIPIALMAAGTALQIVGNYQSNISQSRAELQNARFYKEQADFASASMFRSIYLTERRFEAAKGAQISAYAKGGVDLSGSAAAMIADTVSSKIEEVNAVRLKGKMEVNLALMRSKQAQTTGEALADPMNNMIQAGSILLSNMSRAADSGSSPAIFGASDKLRGFETFVNNYNTA